MIKLSQSTQEELLCLCGLCDHDTYDKNCPYAKMLESSDPNLYQFKTIARIIKSEIAIQNRKSEKRKNASTKTKSKRK